MKALGILLMLAVSVPALAGNEELVATTTRFYEALKANNIAEARKYLSDTNNLPDDGNTQFDIARFQLLNTVVNGDTASIETMLVPSKKDALTFVTVMEKTDGVWKVNFAKSMNNMARDAGKKGQVSGKVEVIPRQR